MMGAAGLTAFVITVHTPALGAACGLGLLGAALVRALLLVRSRGRTAVGDHARAVVVGVVVAVCAYPLLCRAAGVSTLGIEVIGVGD
jgi:hypothetical protein